MLTSRSIKVSWALSAADRGSVETEAAIVIACHNAGHYLADAVASAVAQTVAVEVVVVDDGSDDPSTLDCLNQLRVRGIRVLRQQREGLPSARNAGYRATSAPFVACLDADDVLQPLYMETCLSVICADERLGFVYSTTRIFGDEWRAWGTRRFSPLSMLIDNRIPYSALTRRVAWESVDGYDRALNGGFEDWDFWLGLIEQGWEGQAVSGELFWYRKHGDTMLSRSLENRHRLRRELRSRHSRLYEWGHIAQLCAERPGDLVEVALRAGALVVRETVGPASIRRLRRKKAQVARRHSAGLVPRGNRGPAASLGE